MGKLNNSQIERYSNEEYEVYHKDTKKQPRQKQKNNQNKWKRNSNQ